MKIAIFTDVYEPSGSGGIVSSIRAQKAELKRLGHEVVVFCPGFKTKDKDVFLVPSHKRVSFNDSVIAMRPKVVEEYILANYPDFEKFDIIHVHYEASCSIAGVRLAKKFSIPLVQTMHGREDLGIAWNVPHPLKLFVATSLERMHHKCLPSELKVKKDAYLAPSHTRAKMWQMMVNHAEQADVVTTPAAHMARKLEHYGVTRPIVVVPNGIPDELVKDDFSERKMEDGDVLKLVWSSRASNEKRIIPFLKALMLMKRPYMLYVYGDGNTTEEAAKFAKKHGLKAKFYGAQPREKIQQKMREAHLSVLASYNFDTQPMVLLEAQAAGLPVFFCDPTMMEIVPTGSFVLAGGPEPAAMAIALDKMEAADIAKMSRVMLKHQKDVLQSVQVKKLLEVYKMAKKEKEG